MTTLYGIKNCDSVKKAQKWLSAQSIDYTFHDFKTQGLSETLLTSLLTQSNWEAMLNKRSTTYRNLPETFKSNLTSDNIFEAVIAQPTLLKRPLLAINNQLHVGFKAEQYQRIFN
jgi:arsenate reductase